MKDQNVSDPDMNSDVFCPPAEKKKLLLAEKYQELKRSGKLHNFLSRKRKRNAGKDRRRLPELLDHRLDGTGRPDRTYSTEQTVKTQRSSDPQDL